MCVSHPVHFTALHWSTFQTTIDAAGMEGDGSIRPSFRTVDYSLALLQDRELNIWARVGYSLTTYAAGMAPQILVCIFFGFGWKTVIIQMASVFDFKPEVTTMGHSFEIGMPLHVCRDGLIKFRVSDSPGYDVSLFWDANENVYGEWSGINNHPTRYAVEFGHLGRSAELKPNTCKGQSNWHHQWELNRAKDISGMLPCNLYAAPESLHAPLAISPR
ncbi:hypothetical protein AMATHDRAFT_4735 [Amanita thiersii Skay4041]|uniref:Uncharacterized protein n=1 Tax=Amanita thiersii Skay4041 TaxID=703135 RepID=A0A2A9NF69_9AGAR|nr:hypothetical protein AMATHDRAFT_4735 [Amanita thiersii Skay4041]